MRRFVGMAVVGFATLAPTLALGDDEQIAQNILQQLQLKKEAGELKGFGIDLEVEDGTVWMKGHVQSPEQQRVTLDVARRVAGVQKVVDELTVKAAQPAKIAAATPVEKLLEKPKAVLSEKLPPLPAGPSKLSLDSTASESIAPATEKVTANVDALEAATPAETPAGEIAANSLRRGLDAPSRPAAAGKTSLFGSLSKGMSRAFGGSETTSKAKPPELRQVSHDEESPATPTPAKAAAVASPGATAAQPAGNDALVQAIAQKLREEKQAGGLKGFNVDLNCKEGVVWVSGHVANAEQHSRVIDIVRRVKGVKRVVNDLKVVGADGGVGTVNHTDPSTPAAQGTGVVRRAVNAAQFAEPTGPSPQAFAPQNVQMAPMAMHPQAMPPQAMYAQPMYAQPMVRPGTPLAFAPAQSGRTVAAQNLVPADCPPGTPMPAHMGGPVGGAPPARYDHPNMPGYAWPSYASHPNYAAVTYPKQYSPSAWPYIGPFYPYPQVPLGWRKVMLEWDDGWWQLDFKDK